MGKATVRLYQQNLWTGNINQVLYTSIKQRVLQQSALEVGAHIYLPLVSVAVNSDEQCPPTTSSASELHTSF